MVYVLRALQEDPAAGAQKIILQKLENISTYRKKNIILHTSPQVRWGDSEWFGKLLTTHPWPTKHIVTFFFFFSIEYQLNK